MRKKMITQVSTGVAQTDHNWLDVEHLAQVELTSESAGHPVESALIPGTGPGWRAAQPGEQTIRLVFDKPLGLRRIFLLFREEEQTRTQEFVLRWSPGGEESFREILRQQYTFSPPNTTQEIEDYSVELNGVAVLELRIVPDISGGNACATLTQLRLA
jgi:hypothetical protein